MPPCIYFHIREEDAKNSVGEGSVADTDEGETKLQLHLPTNKAVNTLQAENFLHVFNLVILYL